MSDRVLQDMPEEAGAAGSAESVRLLLERSLTQAEIDAFTAYPEESRQDEGDLRGVAEAGAVSREPMPTLDVVFDRFVRRGAAGLKSFLNSNVDLKLLAIETLRFGDYIDGIAQPAQMFEYKMSGWTGDGLITIPVSTSVLVLESLLGGGLGSARARPVSRPATAIETRILSQVATALLREAEQSFSQVAPVSFELARAESDPRALEIVPPGEAVLLARLLLEIDGRSGPLDIVLPFAAIEPIQHLLKERFNGEKLGRDSAWSAHLATQVWQAEIGARAVLHEVRLPLGRVLDLCVGQTLMLDVKPTDLITLKIGDQVLTRGRIGRVDGRIAMQVTEHLHPGRASGLQDRNFVE